MSMTGKSDESAPNARSKKRQYAVARLNGKHRHVIVTSALLGAAFVIGSAGAAWLGSKASEINFHLASATQLIPILKEDIKANKGNEAIATVQELRSHTAAAKEAAEDPLWTLASAFPKLGSNFSAIAEVSRSADDVATLGLTPLVRVYTSLNWETLIPSSAGINLKPLEEASPGISAAAHAVQLSADRLKRIDTAELTPQVAGPLVGTRDQLSSLTGALDAAADASTILPEMLGAQEPRNYLLMIQNSAEIRASGGIPGALAVLNVDQGKLTLGAQASASAIGVMSPVVPFDPEQRKIYSERIGKYMQDVNMTPDFPTAAETAQAMWERKTGQRVDGVISVDAVALAYVLDATGPVSITDPDLLAIAGDTLPTELTGENVVQTLLSDVYAQIKEPAFQDAYFAGIAQEVFAALSTGKGDAEGMLKGLTRGSAEGRILVWSGLTAEQSVISKYALGGSITGPSVSPAEFGVFFNDGTGAKMDYYVTRTVQVLKECPRDGYEQTTVRIIHTNTAPTDAATSLPAYVTGNGVFGVPPGSVETNILAYGPVQAVVETATIDGQKVGFAPYLHASRPVGVVSIRLAPGETRTVDIKFGRIVQHAEPNIVVTPTVQNVNDVLLPTQSASCG